MEPIKHDSIDESSKTTGKVVYALILNGAFQAIKYVSPKFVVRATRMMTKSPSGKRGFVTGQNVTITLTLGRPNYREREFIKDCKKAGEPFPIKNILLKMPPSPRAKKNRK